MVAPNKDRLSSFQQSLNLSPQPGNFGLVLLLPLVLPHELVTDQSARQKSDGATDKGACSSMSRGAADDGAGCRTETAADEAALLSFGDGLCATHAHG